MEPNSNFNQPDWDRVLTVLNAQPGAETISLTVAERELLDELRDIKAAGLTYENEMVFNTEDRWLQFVQQVGEKAAPVRLLHRRWMYAAAATALLFASTGLFFYLHNKAIVLPIRNLQAVVIQPGGNKATLMLAGGRKINLTDASSGKLAQQAGSLITKTGDGSVTYEQQPGNDHELSYNTIATPRGGQYCLTLPDGTRVWLNAATSLTYPTSFSGLGERKVMLSGEAFFEVKHNASQPFRVVTGSQVTEDIGTRFNLEAYTDDDIVRTTLTEGAVKVSDQHSGNNNVLLRPGQSTINRTGILTVGSVSTAAVTAWKDGYFVFADDDIYSVMKELARWYDVKVFYRGDLSAERFRGNYLRSRSLNKLLKALEQTNPVNFKIEEGRVTVIAR